MSEQAQKIEVRHIEPSPFNREIDHKDLGELTQSIKLHGVIQPLIGRPFRKDGDPRLYVELVSGERRWRAAIEAGLDVVPVLVRDLTDQQAIEQQAIENLQREDLTPIEEARKYQQLLEIYEKDEAVEGIRAIDKLCERTGKARSTVYERLALLKLAPAAQEIVSAGRLPPSHAALLTKLPPERQGEVAIMIAPPDKKTAEKLDDMDGWDVERGENLLVSFRDTKEVVDRAARRAKEAIVYEKNAAALRARGAEVFTYEQAYGGELDLVSREDYLSDWNSYVRELVGKIPEGDLPKYVIRPNRQHPDKAEPVYRKKELITALKKAKVKPKTFGHAGASADYKEREKKRQARERAKKAIMEKVIPQIQAAAGKRNAKVPWSLFLRTLGGWTAQQVCRRRKWKYTWQNAAQQLGEHVAKLPENQIPGLLADILIEKVTNERSGTYGAGFVELGKFYGVDVKAIARENIHNTDLKAVVKKTFAKSKVQTTGKKTSKAHRASAAYRARLAKLMKERWAARRKKAKK